MISWSYADSERVNGPKESLRYVLRFLRNATELQYVKERACITYLFVCSTFRTFIPSLEVRRLNKGFSGYYFDF